MKKTRTANVASLEIVGADANNLKNVDVVFPLKGISVVVGVSGSGKSSLLSDTLAAEGSTRMRTFIGLSQQELERADVGAFVGPMPPTILVGQRGFRPSVRTTVATATGLLAVLRRLFVQASAPYSERAKVFVPSSSAPAYAEWLAKHYRGPAEVWAAPVRQQRTDGVSAVKRLGLHDIKRMVVRSETDPPRLRESGREVDIADFKALNSNVAHTIEALVGIVDVARADQAADLGELLERAFRAASGSVVVSLPAARDPYLLGPFGPRLDSNRDWVHPDDPAIFARPTTHLLSFNAPEHSESGACRACAGTGIGRRLREGALVKHPSKSMSEGAFAIWTEKNYKYVNIQHETIEGLRGVRGFSPDTAWSKLPALARALVLDGSGEELIFDRERSGRQFGAGRRFPGFKDVILEKSAAGTKTAEQLAPYVETGPCDVCAGTRWSFQARALRIGNYGVAEILGATFSGLETMTAAKSGLGHAVGGEMRSLVEALHRHARSLVHVGLGYLTGDRGMLAVSEGESRRIRLARVLEADEKGLCLLLDEPARGLHELDVSRLATALRRLRGEHTIVLNEHRERLWEAADWLVEVGPGAGDAGGRITYAGPPTRRTTADSELLREPLPIGPKQPKLKIRGASIHNVQDVSCDIPLGRLTCISGLSGSGKSSFVRGVLAPALLRELGGSFSDFTVRDGQWTSIDGIGSVREVVALDQVMPPQNRRSLVATLTGALDRIRTVFGTSAAAKRDGLSASDFGVNAGHGRCVTCLGSGEVADGEMWSVCPSCGGARYGRPALSIRIAGTNIQELLDTPIEQLGALAGTFEIPEGLISAMSDLGIGYIALGRRIDSLSGGEVQRLRLAQRLSGASGHGMLFILDEPAVGLHPQDVHKLAAALTRLLNDGRNTIVIVEHELRLIRAADWVLEFGPGSGPDGGEIVYAGPPAKLAQRKTPTGLALAGKLPSLKREGGANSQFEPNSQVPLDEQVERSRALLRALIHGDTSPAFVSTPGRVEPVVEISERLWEGRDGWEIGGLDREIPKLLLDIERGRGGGAIDELIVAWETHPDCWLAIHPFLTDMQAWGRGLPASVRHAVSSHVVKEGLRLVTTDGKPSGKDVDVRHVRATGRRLIPADDSEDARRRVLRDAFAIGARYVELRDGIGRLRGMASDRLVDLEEGIVGPLASIPSHFSRHDALGRCPMCKGRRSVVMTSESLVIGNRNVPPDSEKFLTPQAQVVMKGVYHTEFRPFLRRLEKEELWNNRISFARLDRASQDMILFGFWSRPGHGSFVKAPSANPAEVSAWLRWDGLYQHLMASLNRSPDDNWARRVRERARPTPCGLCGGTGLRSFAALLKVGSISFARWSLLHDSSDKVQYLRDVDPTSARQRRTQQRILHCLAPMKSSAAPDALGAVAHRAVESFTTMVPLPGREPVA